MKNIIIIILSSIIISCESNRKENFEILKENIPSLEKIITEIVDKHGNNIKHGKNKNRIIFSNCESKGFESPDCIYDSEIINQMETLNLKEIRFEKVESSCEGNYGFTEIWFMLEKSTYEETSYFLFEYCGTSSKYNSATIFYEPLNKNWGLYVESN